MTAGLADDSGWCPIQGKSFESTIHPGIHIVGDAAIQKPLPKSGYAANSEAKVCAAAIVSATTTFGRVTWSSLSGRAA